MLWLALHLPWLPLEAVASGAHALPRCVMHPRHDHAGHDRVVLLADAAAAAAGVVPGMSLASALGLLPALRGLSLPLQRFVWVTPPDPADAAWALEQALRSGGIGTALWWGDAGTAMLRRLHLAALEHGCWLLALRPPSARGQSSPAPLRLACRPAARERLAVDVFKRRGPAQAAPLLLHLPPVAGQPLNTPDHVVARPAPTVVAA